MKKMRENIDCESDDHDLSHESRDQKCTYFSLRCYDSTCTSTPLFFTSSTFSKIDFFVTHNFEAAARSTSKTLETVWAHMY